MKEFCKKLVKYTGKLIKYAIIAVVIWITFFSSILFLGYIKEKIWPPRPIKEVMAENYELHKEEILDLKNYFKSITNDGRVKVSIEFGGWNKVDHLCANGDCFSSSDQDKDDLHKITSELGWDDKTLKTLNKKLKAANCISIENFLRDGLFRVGFKRSGFFMYSYTIFDKDLATDLTEEEFKKFGNNCNLTYYKDNIVFSFEGGVIGPQCFFDDFKRKAK